MNSEEPVLTHTKNGWTARSSSGWSVRGDTEEEAKEKFLRIAARKIEGESMSFVCVRKGQVGGK